MDYDRNDALLHWIFRHTQGDAWFRPEEAHIAAGVALRVSPPSDQPPDFRLFPYENTALEPFERAVRGLNPAVAVKLRSAAVHAALAAAAPDEHAILVDPDTRIQLLPSIHHLPAADKDQGAAFIRDERVLVVWSDDLDRIVPTCADLDDRLIRLLWRIRPLSSFSPSLSLRPSSTRSSVDGSLEALASRRSIVPRPTPSDSLDHHRLHAESDPAYHAKFKSPLRNFRPTDLSSQSDHNSDFVDIESRPPSASTPRKMALYAPVYNGLAAGISVLIVGNGIKIILQESVLDPHPVRFALFAFTPFLLCISLFFALQIIQNLSMVIGPIEQYHTNSTYYSAVKPAPNPVVDDALPHITIQMPVYKESLDTVLSPSIGTIKKAMQTYARQGGSSSIFVNDDGLRLLDPAARDARIAFYALHGIAWVARPPHGDLGECAPEGVDEKAKPTGHESKAFVRAGRFKKASNMNYALALTLKLERHLQRLLDEGPRIHEAQSHETVSTSSSTEGHQPSTAGHNNTTTTRHPLSNAYVERGPSLEDQALALAIDEAFEESGRRHRPWAANARAARIGEIVLLVDSDTVVPEDCLRDAAREMAECPEVAILQHDSDVMQVANHYFENGIAYFTRRINRCISVSCANGEVAPFVGHNAFLRWRAIQDVAFIDANDTNGSKEKIWSENNVSEDFDMALRLMLKGYIVRWATYSRGGFKEGVSLSVDDELNRWQKYAYGCSELLFNPFVQWFRRGPIAQQIHRFMWCSAPLHYKISMLSYMFSYYGIAAAVTIAIINYILLGFQFTVDGYYLHSFEIWLATTAVFFGSGTVGYSVLQYRIGTGQLVPAFLENLMWIPFFFFFFGGLSIPLSQAILAHMFSYNISWSATIKEVQRSNFFKEIPKIAKRFWFPMSLSIMLIVGMIVCASSLMPLQWRVDGTGWAVIYPVSLLAGSHLLFPIVLNPWLMVFSY